VDGLCCSGHGMYSQSARPRPGGVAYGPMAVVQVQVQWAAAGMTETSDVGKTALRVYLAQRVCQPLH
jgi:hypothetical protein